MIQTSGFEIIKILLYEQNLKKFYMPLCGFLKKEIMKYFTCAQSWIQTHQGPKHLQDFGAPIKVFVIQNIDNNKP